MSAPLKPEKNRYALLCRWEANGYHDSDFYAACWDREEQKVVSWETGSTRYCGGRGLPDTDTEPKLDDVDGARRALASYVFETIKAAEELDVLQPEPDAGIVKGGELALLENHNYRPRKAGLAPCSFVIGEHVRVVDYKAWGTFYRNGYNRPSRANTSVLVEHADGRRGRIPATKLRLAREPLSDGALWNRAERLSWDGRWDRMMGCRAWSHETPGKRKLDELRESCEGVEVAR